MVLQVQHVTMDYLTSQWCSDIRFQAAGAWGLAEGLKTCKASTTQMRSNGDGLWTGWSTRLFQCEQSATCINMTVTLR